MIVLVVLAAALARAGDTLPPAPTPPPPPDRDAPVQPDELPAFGSDVSVGYLVGSLLGSWPEPGAHGVLMARYEAFARDRDQRGPRVGASIWGSTTFGLLQQADESDPEVKAVGGSGERFPFGFTHFGVMAVLRPEPAAPLGALAGLGFGRLDLSDYYGGAQVLPMLTFEAGARVRAHQDFHADLLLRGHWATTRSPTRADAMHEWWMVQAGVNVGWHVR